MKHAATQEETDQYCYQLGFEGGPGQPHFSLNAFMYFYGYVAYEDGLNRRFESGFLRGYDFKTKRFTPAADPD